MIGNKFKCEKCKFVSNSEQGLKTHVAKKHKSEKKKEIILKFPVSCELCDKELKDKREMLKHQKSHSYQYVAYKCVKCEFLGEDEIAMDVHIGKEHGDKFACGLCDYIAKDLETLEIHLSTCETYTCTTCDIVFKSLSETKTHFIQKHESEEKKQLCQPY